MKKSSLTIMSLVLQSNELNSKLLRAKICLYMLYISQSFPWMKKSMHNIEKAATTSGS